MSGLKYCETDRCGKIFICPTGSDIRDCEKHRPGTRAAESQQFDGFASTIPQKIAKQYGTDLNRRQRAQLQWITGFKANG